MLTGIISPKVKYMLFRMLNQELRNNACTLSYESARSMLKLEKSLPFQDIISTTIFSLPLMQPSESSYIKRLQSLIKLLYQFFDLDIGFHYAELKFRVSAAKIIAEEGKDFSLLIQVSLKC